ncbi:MAG: hypothetical protein GY953_00045 [bacterium]|nr:hypothetical protein [bacterium]
MDHIEATPLSRLEREPGYLEGLSEHEQQQEKRLINEVAQYYHWVHQDQSPVPGPVPGGFENTWTLNTGDREAAGVGAA